MKTNETLKTWYYTIKIPSDKKNKFLQILESNNIEWISLWDNHKKESLLYAMLTIDTIEKVNLILTLWLQINHFEWKDFKPTYDRENFWII